jgi:hypothetical protein
MRAASLARDDRIYAADADAARARRDLAITGYLQLRKAVQDDGPIALGPFYDAATALVQRRLPQWKDILAAGPVAVTAAVSDRWTALAGGVGRRHGEPDRCPGRRAAGHVRLADHLRAGLRTGAVSAVRS